MPLRLCLFICASIFLIDVVAARETCGSFRQMTCPNDIFNPEARYCCEASNGYPYCCKEDEFIGRLGKEDEYIGSRRLGAGIIVTIVVMITGALIACCLCCLCCPCCILYKRRNPGTVYTPAVNTAVVIQSQQGIVQPVQPNVPYPVQPQAAAYPVPGYMPMPMPMPQSAAAVVPPQDPAYMQQPPPYSVATANDPYVKQSPYNPTY